MDEYGDLYYIDDTRNATRDHRAQGGTVPAGFRPSLRTTRAVVVQPSAPAGSYRPAPGVPVYSQQPQMVYAQQPLMYGEPSPTAGSLLGRLTLGEIIKHAADGFAALKSLPPPPSPQAETATNVQNLILYQSALAEHAKFDEKIRTFGAILAKLAG